MMNLLAMEKRAKRPRYYENDVWTKQGRVLVVEKRATLAARLGRQLVMVGIAAGGGALGGWATQMGDTVYHHMADSEITHATAACAQDIQEAHLPPLATSLPRTANCGYIAFRVPHDQFTGRYDIPPTAQEFIAEVSVQPSEISAQQQATLRLGEQVGGAGAVALYGALALASLGYNRKPLQV